MRDFSYFEGKFPRNVDVWVKHSQGRLAFVGRHTYGVEKIKIHSWEKKSTFFIGRFCSIAQTNFFLDGNHPSHFIGQGLFLPKFFTQSDFVDSMVVDDFSSNGDISIGSDVWIGENSTIMSGVKISDGAIVAANSHVVRNVEPYSIVGGNPARHIKFRFDRLIVDLLNELQWWNYTDDVINSILMDIRSVPTIEKIKGLISRLSKEHRDPIGDKF